MKKSFFSLNLFEPVFKHYADFKGCMGRKNYWLFVLCLYLVQIVAISINFWVCSLVSLALFIPSLSAVVRRLHDIGKSGKWIFILFVPIIGSFWLLFLVCKRGKEKTQYTWSLSDWLIVVGVVILIGAKLLLGGGDNETTDVLSFDSTEVVSADYYPINIPCKNADGSAMIALATDDPEIYKAVKEGYIPEGNISIVEVKGKKYRKILSTIDIWASKEFRQICEELRVSFRGFIINTISPDKDDADLIDFTLGCNGLDIDDIIVGTVDIRTGEFAVFKMPYNLYQEIKN